LSLYTLLTYTYHSFFFLHSSSHHPDLHSFPTRRSSDLANDERPFLWSNGTLQRLDLPPGYEIGDAYGIADNGDVAGLAMVPLNLGAHGMLWSGGTVYDLNDLIDTHDWLVTSAAGVTRDGNIVAYASNRDMQAHPVVLIRKGPPVPDRSWRGGGTVL